MTAQVLIVDDSAMMIELLTKGLEAAGISCVSATTLEQVEERLATNTPDVVVVDVNMPEVFGDDVVDFLKNGKGLKAKLLLYSDIDEDELKSRAESSGADGYVLKSAGLDSAVVAIKARLSAEPKRRWRVLIVDDSESTAKLIEVELASKGFEVLLAGSADEATKIILKKKTRPDMVLLDVRMPNVNGEEFCRFIKSNALFSGIKVLLCSAEDETELKRIVRDAGADGYVTKDSLLAKSILNKLA